MWATEDGVLFLDLRLTSPIKKPFSRCFCLIFLQIGTRHRIEGYFFPSGVIHRLDDHWNPLEVAVNCAVAALETLSYVQAFGYRIVKVSPQYAAIYGGRLST